MKQPLAGLVATLAIVAISLAFISLFPFPVFSSWVAYLIDCVIPVQIMIGVTWGASHPAFAASRPQPMKGIFLALVAALVGAVLAVALWMTVGHGINPPTPVLIFFMIDFVLTTFWFAIMMGGWPFVTLFKNPLAAGFAMLAGVIVMAYVIFHVFFDFSFMAGAPFYRPESDPRGMFNAWSAVVYYVTVIAAMFVLAAFDLWPLHKFPALMKQPVLGICWTLISAAIAGVAFYIGVVAMGMEPASFMVAVPIPFIFGTIIVLNMLQGSLYPAAKPPLKGVLNFVTIAVVGTVLARIYTALMPSVSGPLKGGAPTFDFEIWLASALLSVTFPLLVCHAEFFKLWPLRKAV
jgi:hypothetical protein